MNNCLFCKIVEKKIPAKIVYEDDRAIAFDDIDPKAPVHTLVIPKQHFSTILDVPGAESSLMAHLLFVAREVARQKGIAERGFRVVTNCNPDGGQSVYHLHLHVIGGRQMQWPPG